VYILFEAIGKLSKHQIHVQKLGTKKLLANKQKIVSNMAPSTFCDVVGGLVECSTRMESKKITHMCLIFATLGSTSSSTQHTNQLFIKIKWTHA
jgi:hypothetical protein